MYQLKVHPNFSASNEDHWIKAFYQREEKQSTKIYRCICKKLIPVGKDEKYEKLKDLQEFGCECGHKNVFVFNTDVPLQ